MSILKVTCRTTYTAVATVLITPQFSQFTLNRRSSGSSSCKKNKILTSHKPQHITHVLRCMWNLISPSVSLHVEAKVT